MKKGPLFEKWVVMHLNEVFDTDTIERRLQGGSNDRGDVSGLYWRGMPFVVEVKNRNRITAEQWLQELEVECGNADTDLGAVVFHRQGVGEAHMENQGVLMTFATLCKLLGGEVDG